MIGFNKLVNLFALANNDLNSARCHLVKGRAVVVLCCYCKLKICRFDSRFEKRGNLGTGI